jgi:hypothetical protein
MRYRADRQLRIRQVDAGASARDAHALPMLDSIRLRGSRARSPSLAHPDCSSRCDTRFCDERRWVVEGCYAGSCARLCRTHRFCYSSSRASSVSRELSQQAVGTAQVRVEAVQDQHLEFLLAWVREYYSRAATSRSPLTRRCSTSIAGRSTSSRTRDACGASQDPVSLKQSTSLDGRRVRRFQPQPCRACR